VPTDMPISSRLFRPDPVILSGDPCCKGRRDGWPMAPALPALPVIPAAPTSTTRVPFGFAHLYPLVGPVQKGRIGKTEHSAKKQ
jgi:hypothetical protein